VLLTSASAAPDEAFGTVIEVIDGDTIEVRLASHDGRITENPVIIRLADIDAPEMNAPGGPDARRYASQILSGKAVALDLDDLGGKDQYGRWVAVVYLQQAYAPMDNANRMMVDSGQACIWDFTDNEFSPASWWIGSIPATACIKSDSSSGFKPFIGPGSAWAGPGQGAREGMEDTNYFSQVATGHTYSGPGYGPGTGHTSSSGFGSVSSYSSSGGPFVGSVKSNKYHYPGCEGAQQIKPKNLIKFSSSAEARAAGYVPCKICTPP